MKNTLTEESQVTFRCAGCGKQEPGYFADGWHKPIRWFQRSDKDGAQIACSRECIAKVCETSGKTGLVAPI